MIISFGDKNTEKIWNGMAVKKPSIEIQEIGNLNRTWDMILEVSF